MTLDRAISFGTEQLRKTVRRPTRLVVIPWHIVRSSCLMPWVTLDRAISFGAEQLRKTVCRPARLVVIPWHIVRSSCLMPWVRRLRYEVFSLLTRCAMAVGPGLAKRVPSGRELFGGSYDEYWHEKGQKLLNDNKPAEAWKIFSRAIDGTKDFHLTLTSGACLQQGLGRARKGIRHHVRTDELRLALSASMGLPKGRYFVLDRLWIEYFGHAAQVDYIIKLAILDRRDQNDTILYFPPEMKVANRFLVEQWAPHLKMVARPRDLPFPEDFLKLQSLNFFVPDVGHGRPYYLWELAAQTYRRWHKQGRGPVLSLPPDIESQGWSVLASAGVPHGAWIVALHVRSPGFNAHHRGLHHVLNAEIEDYLPAIQEITRRGGWVIRMGDASMPALPPLANVLDYCHSAIRCDWMDVFLCATCRFFIGTPSGVCYAPQAYGIPCVLTNWWPPAQRPWHPGDIFIPKLHRRIRTGECLSLEQGLREPFGYCNSMDHLREAYGVGVQSNDPEDIRSAVVEMMERIDGSANYTERDLAMRERAEGIYATVAMELYESSAAFGSAALARDFLRRNPTFLDRIPAA